MNSKNIYLAIVFSIFSCTPKPQETIKDNSPESILLKDYKPVSIYNVPETKVEKAKYPAIDMHSHPYPKSAAELDQWVKNMDEAGIAKTMVLTYSHGSRFDSLVQAFSKYPDRFDLWCGFDYTGYDQPGFPDNAVKELERCHTEGAKGVGELGDKGKGLFYSKPAALGMHSDDPRMDALFEKCAELGMPVNIHVADPKWMYEKMDSTNDGLMNAWKWKIEPSPDVVDHAGMMKILANTVSRHPHTTFIACHLANCCYDLSIIGKMLDENPNLNIDIAARFSELAPIPIAAREFITKYQDRIVYGTDQGYNLSMYRTTFRILETADEHFYVHDYDSYHWPLYGLHLSDDVLKKVYHDNAARIIGI